MTRTELASSHLDTVSGQEGDHDRNQGGESGYVTIQEAARRCGVNPKTIQRAIRAGTIPARYPLPNRCEIAVSDLNAFIPGHVQTATKHALTEQASGHVQTEMEQRVAILEQRVQQLEHLVAALQEKPAVPKRPNRAKARERTRGPLSKQWVSLLAEASLHNIAESMVQTHMGMELLPVKQGAWTDADGTEVLQALDEKGRAAFYQMYRSLPHFTECPHCPHGYQDSVSGQS